MKRPLTGLVAVYASGILVGSWFGWPVVGVSVAAAAGVGLFFHSRRAAWLWLAVFCAGWSAYRFSVTNSEPQHLTKLLSAQTQTLDLRGVILDDPGYREDGAANQRLRFRLSVTELRRSEVWEPASGVVLIFGSEAREPTPVRYGDEIECSVQLRAPPPASNPGAFDWRRWLARDNIQFIATLRKSDECRVLATERGNPVLALSLRLRENFERALRVGLEDQPRLAGVLAGMVIGERSEIPADTYAHFQQTGVFHVFSISGLHVGVVTLVVVTVLRLARVPRRWCGLLAIPVLILYVFATGARPGAMRALVMAGVWLGGWLLVRPTDSLNNLAAAALAILVWQPAQLFDGGFLLSFTAVWALVVMAPRIEARMWPWVAADPSLPRVLWPRWRWALDEPARWLVKLVSCAVAAWIGLLPLMAVYFNLFTPVSILANIVVVPLVGLIIPIGMLSAAVPAFAATLNNANFFLLDAMIRVIDWLGQVRGGHWFVQTPPVWASVGFYALLGAFLAGWLRWRWLAVFGLGSLAVAVWPRDHVEITVLDLRDGVAVFVNAPGEDNDWLIDGGGRRGGERTVVPYLRGQGVDRLAAVVLTRGDRAHAAGLTAVTERVPVRQAIHAGTGSRSTYFWDWLVTMRKGHLEIVTLRAGEAGENRRLGPVVVRALHPRAGQRFARSDDNSLVLLLEYGPTRVLLASDIGATVEQQLATAGDLRAHVLIQGRHGAETSGTDVFLDAIQPEVVIQAVGSRYNQYPEPARPVKLYRTDKTGAVTVRLDKNGYTIRTCFNPAEAAR